MSDYMTLGDQFENHLETRRILKELDEQSKLGQQSVRESDEYKHNAESAKILRASITLDQYDMIIVDGSALQEMKVDKWLKAEAARGDINTSPHKDKGFSELDAPPVSASKGIS